MSDLKEQLSEALGGMQCRYAFYCRLQGAEPIQLGDIRPFVSASVIKVPILFAWAYLERQGRVDRGEMCEMDLEPQVAGSGLARLLRTRRLPYHDVLLMMIALSDNLCTNLVIRRIGMARLNSLFRDVLGLRDAALNRRMMDAAARAAGQENYVSARDCIRLYALRDGLSPEERAWIEPMLTAEPGRSPWLRDLPPDSVVLAHKGGELEGVLHSWAYTDRVDLFVLTQDVNDYGPVYRAYGRIGSMLLRSGA